MRWPVTQAIKTDDTVLHVTLTQFDMYLRQKSRKSAAYMLNCAIRHKKLFLKSLNSTISHRKLNIVQSKSQGVDYQRSIPQSITVSVQVIRNKA